MVCAGEWRRKGTDISSSISADGGDRHELGSLWEEQTGDNGHSDWSASRLMPIGHSGGEVVRPPRFQPQPWDQSWT